MEKFRLIINIQNPRQITDDHPDRNHKSCDKKVISFNPPLQFTVTSAEIKMFQCHEWHFKDRIKPD